MTKTKLILQYIKNKDVWVSGLEIEKYAFQIQIKPSTASRLCRDLAEQGIIERDLSERGTVKYRFKREQHSLF